CSGCSGAAGRRFAAPGGSAAAPAGGGLPGRALPGGGLDRHRPAGDHRERGRLGACVRPRGRRGGRAGGAGRPGWRGRPGRGGASMSVTIGLIVLLAGLLAGLAATHFKDLRYFDRPSLARTPWFDPVLVLLAWSLGIGGLA